MPELPEVETVKNTLKNHVIGHTIIGCTSYWDNIIVGDVTSFSKRIRNQKIYDVLRRGKFLIFELEEDVLLSHLRMEGKYFYCNTKEEKGKHSHICLHLDKNKDLRYDDVRKFGTLQLVSKKNYLHEMPIVALGKEPFEIEVEDLYGLFQKTSLPIKSALLNQKIIAGIGNIYANEICFAARLNPYKKARDLTIEEVGSLIEHSKKILLKAIDLGGTSIHSFSNDGITGLFQQELYVHGLVKKPCLICGTTIRKSKIQQRGTYYCPKCQGVKE